MPGVYSEALRFRVAGGRVRVFGVAGTRVTVQQWRPDVG
jgi:hypothetical protein